MIEVLFFSGKSCGVCQALKPKLFEELNKLLPAVPVRVIDVKEDPEFTAQHLVFTLPVVIVLLNNKEQYRFARSFSVMEVIDKIKRLQDLTNQ